MGTLTGRRLPDGRADVDYDEIRPGDYWKALGDDGSALRSTHPGNLTGGVWWIAAPMPDGSFGLGRLEAHTVRENEDGTISIRAGDGSSNSILLRGPNGQTYHGYIDHGVWSSVR